MVDMIETRKNSEKVERHDLFSNLLEANAGDGEIEILNADELIGMISAFSFSSAVFLICVQAISSSSFLLVTK
jgi:hypothetical protein